MMYLLAILAVYRLATDLAWERGPYDIYAKLRGIVIAKYGADAWQSDGVSCPICWSFWLALPMLWYGPLEWFGVAGAVAFLVRLRAE